MQYECVLRSAKAASISLAILLAYTSSSYAGLKATQISVDNAAELIQKGPDSIGGIGDWLLSNGTLCAVISDIEHEGEFSYKGGVLVDLGFCGRADDHYTTAQDLVDASRSRPLNGESISVELTESQASVIVRMSTPGATQITTYSVNLDQARQLSINKTLTRNQQEGHDFGLYTPLHFNYHSLEPFVFSSQDLTQSNGFKQQDFVSRGTSAMTIATRNADTIITISPPTAEVPIAYGWHMKSAQRVEGNERYDVPKFVLADDESNAMLVLSDTFLFGGNDNLGWLQLVQIPLLELDQGASLEIQEVIYVGERGDVAAITDQLLSDSQTVSGRVSDTHSALHIDFSDGTPLTHLRPKTDGRFSFKAPVGQYTARLVGSAGRESISEFEVTSTALSLGLLSLQGAASVALPQGEPMRLVFIGRDGTSNPNFIDTFTGSSVIEEDGEKFRLKSPQIFLAGLPGDVEKIELQAGAYRVYATRGPEYSLEVTDIDVKVGESYNLGIAVPQRVLSTPGFIASDLHVHAGQSFDNTFSETERVRTFVAEHGEVMVSSEHDMPVDFAPLIGKMGADKMITSIAAAEVTSLLSTDLTPYTAGHTNFFPYHPSPLEYRRGMVNNENRRLRDIMHDVRQISPNVLVQLNHPRQSDRLSGELPDNWREMIDAGDYFEHMGPAGHPYQPDKPLHSEPNNVLLEADPQTGVRDLDFDLIEVINAGGPDHESRLRAVRKDWLSLVKQGERKVATANSDSHMSAHQVAVPRTMVSVIGDSVASFSEAEFIESLRAGNAYGTTGPMIEIDLSGKHMGETFSGERGQLKMKITSADWISVDLLKVQVNGETISEYQLTDQAINELLIPISFNKDSFVTIEASGPTTQAYRDVYPDISPYAFTNAIFVDYDSDGKWLAPGL
ncbi:MAG: hypothetical protein ACI9FR_001545 [Cryomorphaceae bacterium]|jgi:hypothetical protein